MPMPSDSAGAPGGVSRCGGGGGEGPAGAGRRSLQLAVGHKAVRVAIGADGALELWLDGCLRKRRAASAQAPLHVWTNVELHWEEHRYVEARYWPGRGELEVMVNRALAYAGPFG